MITTFDNEKHFWIVRRFTSKILLLLICSTIVFVTPIYEESLFLTIFLLGIGVIAFLSVFLRKFEIDIFSLIFDDETRGVKVVFYKYGFKRKICFIPYDKLWYYKERFRLEHFSGQYSGFSIQMKESQDSHIQIEFYYVLSSISGAFSEKQLYAILDKLEEVGHNCFNNSENKTKRLNSM